VAKNPNHSESHGAFASECFKGGAVRAVFRRAAPVRRIADHRFHPYRSNAAAVLTLPFGRTPALRALAFMATPERSGRADRLMDAVPLVRFSFGVLVVIGLYLASTGRLAKPAHPD
jgi:hypothetical protein